MCRAFKVWQMPFITSCRVLCLQSWMWRAWPQPTLTQRVTEWVTAQAWPFIKPIPRGGSIPPLRGHCDLLVGSRSGFSAIGDAIVVKMVYFKRLALHWMIYKGRNGPKQFGYLTKQGLLQEVQSQVGLLVKNIAEGQISAWESLAQFPNREMDVQNLV